MQKSIPNKNITAAIPLSEDFGDVFTHKEPFKLENGISLFNFHLAYTTYGKMNDAKTNVVWIFHALTANSKPQEWWPEMIGEGKIFDPAIDFIICVNMPGSCYGSISPLDVNYATNEPYYHSFPFFTTRDMIRSYQLLRDELGINKIKVGIGGSMGGQQLLEWAIEEPDVFECIIPMATNAVHSAWGKAFNASQRFAIEADATWLGKNENAGKKGMEVARSIGLLSYRNATAYNKTQTDASDDAIDNFKSESYQRYQGTKLSARFNAFSYYFLSKGMDSHNVGRGRGGVTKALTLIKAKTLVLSLEGDILFPTDEQQFLANHIPGAQLKLIRSDYGHDGFLLEVEQIGSAIREFLNN